MSIITVGIDLAKNIFAVHGVDENGKAALVKPKVAREQLLQLIVPKFVTPYRMSGKRGKNDAADAAVICGMWSGFAKRHSFTYKRNCWIARPDPCCEKSCAPCS